jgi:hypothetical protein
MSAQLIITMRADFAKQVAQKKRSFDILTLLKRLDTARLIGAPGYSMRVVLDENEVPTLCEALGPDFVVEQDYALQTFSRDRRSAAGRPVSGVAGTPRR